MAEGGQGDSSHADDNTFCQPCKDEGEIKDARGYCQNCQEYMCQHCIKSIHRSSKTKGHTILSGEQMPSTSPKRDDQGSAEEYSELCNVHINEILRFFCPDHKVFECGVCIVLNHRACSVQFVPDVAKGFSNTSEYKDQRNMLREIQNDIQTCEDKVEERAVSANDVHSVVLSDLKKFRKEINEYLDESERDIESSAEHLKASVDEKIEELKNKYVEIKGRADETEQTFHIASSDEVQLFMKSKRSGEDIEGLKLTVDKLKKTCEQDNMRYEFKPDSVFEKILNLKRNLGKMTITNEIENDDESDITADDELDIDESEKERKLGDPIAFDQTPSISNISVISDDDVHQTCSCNSQDSDCSRKTTKDHIKEVKQYPHCNISGMALLSPGRLVVADSMCRSVKLVDTSNNKVLARYSTAPYPTQGQMPFDVTVVSNEKIAVTYGNYVNKWTYQLSILSTENNTLAELYSVPIQALTFVSYINCRFHLSDGSSLSVRDDKINDAQVRKFEIKGNPYHRKPVLNACDGNAYYVTDETSWDTYTLRKVSLDGNTLATYTDWEFKSPGLVIPVRDGNILLYNDDKKELLLMSGNCEKIKSLMKIQKEEYFIKNPSATTFCPETKTLFVSDQQSPKTIKAIQFT